MDIQLDHVDHIYNPGSPMAVQALYDISLTIPSGSYTALIGHTGSGKSTLLQHFNVLLKPTAGQVHIGDQLVTAKSKDRNLKVLRGQIGSVFQFPEAQLFEETVVKDVAFGPKNYGASAEEAEETARRVLKRVGLPESVYDRSPFDLSGGQQRRVAIAGVLALEPSVLLLDEPTAGLDPYGQDELMALFESLHKDQDLTVILATHQMEHVAKYADQAIILEAGRVAKIARPRDLFSQPDWLDDKQLGVPTTVQFANRLEAAGRYQFAPLPITIDELGHSLARQMKK